MGGQREAAGWRLTEVLRASAIDPGTLQAYRETAYRVHGRGSFTMQVDVACPELAAAYRHRQVDCSAVDTA